MVSTLLNDCALSTGYPSYERDFARSYWELMHIPENTANPGESRQFNLLRRSNMDSSSLPRVQYAAAATDYAQMR